MAPKLAIDPATGALEIGASVALAPFASLEAVRDALRDFDVSMRDMKTGWMWAHVSSVCLDQLVCNLEMAFHAGAFEQWGVTVARSRSAWPTEMESADDEKRLSDAMGATLQIGAPLRSYHFSWGEAWCGFDAKGGFSSAGVRYRRPNQ